MPGTGKMTEVAGSKGRKWRLRVYAGRDNRGTVRHVNRTVTGSKRVAQRELAKLLHEVQRGQVKAGHVGSLGDLLDWWLDAIEMERTPYTMKEYRRLAAEIKAELGLIDLRKLTAAHLDGFYAQLRSPRQVRPRVLSAASVRRYHFLIHAALERAVKLDRVPFNVADKATPPGLTRSTATAPSEEVVQALLAGANRLDDGALATAIALAAVTGARRGELCALRWSDVDWERAVLTVRNSLTVIHTKLTLGPTKTHQVRKVALDDSMTSFLLSRRAAQEAYARRVGAALFYDAYLLSRSADGSQPCLPAGITTGFARLAKKLGVKTHFHELRHFAATVAIASGADVRTVAGRLGHADASVTLRVYAHALEQRDREIAGLLGTAVLGVNRGPR